MKVTMELTNYQQLPLNDLAKDKMADLTVQEREELWQYLEDTEPAGGYSVTDINDFICYDDDYIAQMFGFGDWEELYRYRNSKDFADMQKDK